MNLNTSIRPSSRIVAPARKIAWIHPAPEIHWAGDGFRLLSYFSSDNELARKLNPFLLLDYHPPYDYPAVENKQRGAGPQTCRGFEIITLSFAGSITHRDSAGSSASIGPGDVQLLTAASGVEHNEYHAESFARSGGTMHMVGLGVNLPEAHKMAPPRYQTTVADQIRSERLANAAGWVRIIAGLHQGIKGPAKTCAPIRLLDGHLTRKGRAEFSFPSHENTALLVMNGNLLINGQAKVAQTEFVLFANEGERITIDAETDAHWLLLSGEPIREPIVQRDSFVMDSQGEASRQAPDLVPPFEAIVAALRASPK